jgi:LysR family transcriptional regulator, hca operon transcriptional activator
MTPKTSVLSLATSTRRDLMHLYVKLMLPSSVVIRRLQGDAPAIELAFGYSRSNTLLKSFLTRTHQRVARIAKPDTDLLSVP